MPNYQDPLGKLHFLSELDIANGGLALLPDGCVEISDDDAEKLHQPTMSADRKAEIRVKRDAWLVKADAITMRHRDQIEAGIATSLTVDQYHELLLIKQQLRDIPEQDGFPDDVTWPTAPAWIEGAA